MFRSDPIKFDHPANQKILQHLQKGTNFYPDAPISCAPFGANWDHLHTHPDLITYFWWVRKKGLGLLLFWQPVRDAWILYSHPVLVHRKSGVIYGYAGGTDSIALRLPAKEREIAYRIEKYGHRSGDLDATMLGIDWAFIEPFSRDNPAFFEAAYEYAENIDSTSHY